MDGKAGPQVLEVAARQADSTLGGVSRGDNEIGALERASAMGFAPVGALRVPASKAGVIA
jgi:hypothetical protein